MWLTFKKNIYLIAAIWYTVSPLIFSSKKLLGIISVISLILYKGELLANYK